MTLKDFRQKLIDKSIKEFILFQTNFKFFYILTDINKISKIHIRLSRNLFVVQGKLIALEQYTDFYQINIYRRETLSISEGDLENIYYGSRMKEAKRRIIKLAF